MRHKTAPNKYSPDQAASALADASLLRRHFYLKEESFTFPEFYDRKMDNNGGLQVDIIGSVKTDDEDREAYIKFGDPDTLFVSEASFVMASKGKHYPNTFCFHEVGHHRTQNHLGLSERNFSLTGHSTRKWIAHDAFEKDADAWGCAFQVPIHLLDGGESVVDLGNRFHCEARRIDWCRKLLKLPAVRAQTIDRINKGLFSSVPPDPTSGNIYWQGR